MGRKKNYLTGLQITGFNVFIITIILHVLTRIISLTGYTLQKHGIATARRQDAMLHSVPLRQQEQHGIRVALHLLVS
jgi:hypothetical protein